ncbi:Reverse transcriptase, RNA-dependent DNA polymerase domain containing hypothetical protein [Phytophthora palmivora]|uniref:Reverse transcriptase Ty1/copia-type domain-containing protein n=1 Tax=Phytophthora palmivora TaxID=4796 RepID=A0A2P4Y7A7_9STRA|nr:Reverse transcriptase, RNA-dependent DNA polymerase domain containing hypothetical protein [Phytophthora palmivora]
MALPEANHWKEAIRAEVSAHVKIPTYDVVIGFKRAFAHKFNENGEIARYKARLVALGYLQTQCRLLSNVLNRCKYKHDSCVLGCLLQYAARDSTIDIETAFLNRDLEEDVYMAPPLGIRIATGMVCKMRRSLYGLKHAAAIRSVFLSMGSEQCRADPCMFVKNSGANNDLLVGCESDAVADAIRDELAAHFTIDYSPNKGELLLKQTQFITTMLEKFGQNSTPSSDKSMLQSCPVYR